MYQFVLNVYVLCCNVPREQTLPALLGAVDAKLSQISLESRRANHAIALQAASTGLASYLPDEPTTLHEAKVSFEWPQWRGALKREMDGQIARGVWKVVGRPKEKSYSAPRPFLNGRSAKMASRKVQVPLLGQGLPPDQGNSLSRVIVADIYTVEHPDGAGGEGPVGLGEAAAWSRNGVSRGECFGGALR